MQRCRDPSIPGGALGPESQGKVRVRKDSRGHGTPALVAQAEDTRVRDPVLPKEEATATDRKRTDRISTFFFFFFFKAVLGTLQNQAERAEFWKPSMGIHTGVLEHSHVLPAPPQAQPPLPSRPPVRAVRWSRRAHTDTSGIITPSPRFTAGSTLGELCSVDLTV